MKKLILFLFCNFLLAQEKKTVIYYQNEIKNYMSFDVSYQSTLVSDHNESIFFWGDKNQKEIITTDELGNTKTFTKRDSIGSINVFKKDRELLSRFMGLTKFILTTEDYPNMNWVITNERKTILNLSCIKATTNFRGRNYIAWFTNEYPAINGPWKFNNIPGLILEVYDLDFKIHLLANKIELIPFNLDVKFSEEKRLLKDYILRRKKIIEENNLKDINDYLEIKYEWEN